MEHNVSLNQLAIVLGIPVARLQTAQVAHKPIEGEPYDPKAINWKSVDEFIQRRLDKTAFETIEDVYAAAEQVAWTPRTRTGNGASTKQNLFGTVPARKFDPTVGQTIFKKAKDGSNIECVVEYTNKTIVVYTPCADGDVVSEAIGNRMFNVQFSNEPWPPKAEADPDAE